MRGSRCAAALLGAVLALSSGPAAARTPVYVELSGGTWSPGGPPRVRVRAADRPVGEVLAAIARATGVAIDPPPAGLAATRVTLDAGPLPLERVVKGLVRPYSVAGIYGRDGRLTRVVVIPTEGEPRSAAPPATAREREAAAEPRVDGAWWRMEDVGPDVTPEAREAALMTLGGALDDPAAVAILEAAADGRAGLAPDDPARRLARRILAVRAGSDEEDEES